MSDRCCFGAFPIMTGAKMLAVVLIVFAGQSIFVVEPTYYISSWYRIVSILLGVFGVISAIFVFVACEKRNP
ncbi:hypothetical protein PENTCL1PPCAC_595, partial [Pristionchus entomophagus]